MKKTAIAIAVLTSALTVNSCKKEKDVVPCTCPAPGSASSDMYHFPLTIGSYWIYESDNMDSSYNVTSVTAVDSIFIANDTMINGKEYFEKKVINLSGGPGGYTIAAMGFPSISRDSAGYMLNTSGKFIKYDDFTDILDVKTSTVPAYTVVSRMAGKDSSVTVPAGTFTTINYQGKITIQEPSYVGNRTKYNNDIMANNIGVIYQTSSFFSSPGKIGIRLLRYHISS